MIIDRKAMAGALAAALLLAACGGSASPSPSAGGSAPAEATATPAVTAEPTAEGVATPEPDSSFEASFAPGAASDLEALLPTDVNGVAFTRTSFDGQSIPGGVPIGDTELEKLLSDTGKSLSDVRVALASTTDTAAAGSLVMAIQIRGIDPGKLQEWALGTFGDTDASKTTIAGKVVYGAAAAGYGAYLYPKGDVIFYVVTIGADANLAEAVIAKLP